MDRGFKPVPRRSRRPGPAADPAGESETAWREADIPDTPQARFVVNLVALAMGMAKADGALEGAEVRAIKDVFERIWRYSPEDMRIVQALMKRFQGGLTPGQLDIVCQEFLRVSKPEERRLMLQLLQSIAEADGAVRPSEQAYLEQVAQRLGLSTHEFHSRRKPEPDPGNPYHVLGLEPGADLEAVKRAFKQKAAEYHPDKVSHLGRELQEFAHRKFTEINSAYQAILERKKSYN